MKRPIALGAVALLVLAAAVPLTSASTPVTKHVDGSIVVAENTNRTWLARFEVRTTSDSVQFGYLELYGIGGDVLGQIHEFSVYHVDYFKAASGAPGATLWMNECIINPPTPCVDDGNTYSVTDGATVGQDDGFMRNFGWIVQSGNISIYSTGGSNTQ